MKKTSWRVFTAAALAVVLPGGAAWAGSSDDSDTVTVNVSPVLSITDTVGNYTLTFADFAAGSLTNGQTVSYTVKANNMTNSAITGAVSAKISALLDGITFQANPGRTFVNNGAANNATLTESIAGVIVIGTTAVNIMNKPASTGNQGKVLNGTVFVNYSARALRDLSVADGGAVTVTVTLRDV